MKLPLSLVLAVFVFGVSSLSFANEGSPSPVPEINAGQQIFEENCARCHDSFFGGFFGGAPRIGKQKAWKDIIPEGKNSMLQNTIDGKGRMKKRGGCEDCSDDDLRAAIDYIIEQSQ